MEDSLVNSKSSRNTIVSGLKVIKPQVHSHLNPKNGAKIVARLSKEPYIHYDHKNNLNEKRRMRKINSRMSNRSSRNSISETIIMDLEAEFHSK